MDGKLRIQGKYTLLVLFIFLCFILIIFLFYFSTWQTEKYVSIEKETLELQSKWNILVSHTKNILISDIKIGQLVDAWNKSTQDFNDALNRLINTPLVQGLGVSITKEIDNIKSLWEDAQERLKTIQRELEDYILLAEIQIEKNLLFLEGYYYLSQSEDKDKY